MTEEAVETITLAFAAFNRRDVAALIAVCDPEVEWIPMRPTAAGIVYRGHDGVRRALEDVAQEFDELQNYPRRWTELGDRIVVAGRFVAKERRSGLRIDNPGAWLCEMRGGLVARVRAFASEESALRVAREGK